MRTPTTLALALALAVPAAAQQTNRHAETESYDPASPEVPGVSAADVVVVNSTIAGGGGVPWPSALMGLPPGANIDAFSDGTDILPPLPPVQCRTAFVEYTVDRAALGAPGGLVALEVAGDGAASDTFGLRIDGGGGKSYYHVSDRLAVTPRSTAGPTETDLDALGWAERARWPVFYSLDPPSALLFGVLPGDVMTSTGSGTSTIYRSAASLGLTASDDVDGLAVEPTGAVALSVTQGSPRNTVGPFAGIAGAGVLKVAAASPATIAYVTPADLMLLPTDELDGVRITDPGSFHSLDGTEIDSISGFPHEMVRVDGTGGNVDHVVRLGVGQSFLTSFLPKNPGTPYLCVVTPGRPCLCNQVSVGVGTLAAGGFGPNCPGAPLQVLFAAVQPLQLPAQLPFPIELTIQCVLGPGVIQHTSNAVTLTTN